MNRGLQTRFSYLDLIEFPSDGNRYEVLDGELLVTPAPSLLHQRVSKRLHRQLEDYFEPRRLAEVFYAPVDVILALRDVFEPDLVVVSDPQSMTKRGIEDPPLVVVEILSPSTRKRDEGAKLDRYAKYGIPHYWLVEPEEQWLKCLRLVDGAYVEILESKSDSALEHPNFEGLKLDVASLWLGPPVDPLAE